MHDRGQGLAAALGDGEAGHRTAVRGHDAAVVEAMEFRYRSEADTRQRAYCTRRSQWGRLLLLKANTLAHNADAIFERKCDASDAHRRDRL